jgi:hypothetical protein
MIGDIFVLLAAGGGMVAGFCVGCLTGEALAIKKQIESGYVEMAKKQCDDIIRREEDCRIQRMIDESLKKFKEDLAKGT